MYHRILVPLDGSELAEIIIPYVGELARRTGSEVIMMHVCAPHEVHYCHVNQIYLEKMASSLSEELARDGGKKVGVFSLVASGDPAEEILGYAQANDISLIATSTHGRAGIGRWVLGSVADKLVRGSHIPILLVRSKVPERVPAERWPMKGILVPLDGSDSGEAVLPYVEALAKTLDKEVVLLQVITTEYRAVADAAGWDMVMLPEREINRWKASAETYLNKISARLKEKGIASRILVTTGIPDARIIDCARECGVDLVAMTTLGYSGIARFVLGSVADKVLHSVEAPLLLVRPSDTARQSTTTRG